MSSSGRSQEISSACASASRRIGAGDWSGAEEDISRAERLVGDMKEGAELLRVDVLRARALLARNQGDEQRALSLYRQAREVLSPLLRAEDAQTPQARFGAFSCSHAVCRGCHGLGDTQGATGAFKDMIDHLRWWATRAPEQAANLATHVPSLLDAMDRAWAGRELARVYAELPEDQFGPRAVFLSALVRAGAEVEAKTQLSELGNHIDALPGETVDVLGVLSDYALRRDELDLAMRLARRLLELGHDEPTHVYHGRFLVARVHRAQGRKEEASNELRDLTSFAEAQFGGGDPLTVQAIEGAASWFRKDEQYERAIPCYEDALARKAPHVSTCDPQYAKTAEALGYCFDHAGHYLSAIRWYRQAHRACARSLGRTHRDTLRAAGNIAEIHRVLRDYDRAVRGFRRALEVEVTARGERNEHAAHLQNNMGEALFEAGCIEEGIRCIRRAAAVRRSLFGSGSPEYCRSRTALHVAKHRAGKQTLRSTDDLTTLAGDSRIARGTVDSVDLLKAAHAGNADWEQRLAAFVNRGGTGLARRTLDRRHVLAVCEEVIHRGEGGRTRRWIDWVLETDLVLVGDLLGTATSSALDTLVEHTGETLRVAALLTLREPTPTADDLKRVGVALERYKGLPTRTLRLHKPGRRHILTSGRDDSEGRHILNTLRSARRDYMATRLRRRFHPTVIPTDGDLTEAEERVDHLEDQLVSRLPESIRDWEMTGMGAWQKAGDATLDLLRLDVSPDAALGRLKSGSIDRDERYLVLVRRSDKRLHFFDLGSADEIDRSVQEMRRCIVDLGPRSPWLREARFLYRRLVSPLEGVLDGVTHIFVCPDGTLGLLPFELLQDAASGSPDAPRTSLGDRCAISYLTWAAEPNGMSTLINRRASPVVIADLDFGGDEKTAVFPHLQGAREEGETVCRLLGGTLLSDKGVTADGVALLDSPEILHVASHGFALPLHRQEERVALPQALAQRAELTAPMERCGMALSGANNGLGSPCYNKEALTRILYGSEIVDLDLSSTDLVTISSCESGIGDAVSADGTQGLRRAFKAAGARSVVSSLWKIPDGTTARLMHRFYEELVAGRTRSEALRMARDLIREEHPDDPFYWACFILDGEVGALRRHSQANELRVASISMRELNAKTIDITDTRAPVPVLESAYERARSSLDGPDGDRAAERLRTIIDHPRTPPDLRAMCLYEVAGHLRKRGHTGEALAIYDEIHKHPYLPKTTEIAAWADRSTTHALRGEWDRALPWLTRALDSPDLEPQHRDFLLVNRGAAYQRLGRPEEALVDWNTLIQSPLSDSEQRFNAAFSKASLLHAIGRDALAAFQTVLEMAEPGTGLVGHDNQVAWAHLCVGERVGLDQPEAGMRHLGHAVALSRDPILRALAHVRRADAALERGARDAAVQDAASAWALREEVLHRPEVDNRGLLISGNPKWILERAAAILEQAGAGGP